MKNAIRLYGDTANLNSFPTDVIYESLIVDDSVSSPPAGYSLLLSDEDMAAYIDSHSDSYATFATAKAAVDLAEQTRAARRKALAIRIAWGERVIVDFRDYAVGMNMNSSDSLTMMSALLSTALALKMGLLGPACILLNAIPSNGFLDSTMDPTILGVVTGGQTVRQYFVAEIAAGNI